METRGDGKRNSIACMSTAINTTIIILIISDLDSAGNLSLGVQSYYRNTEPHYNMVVLHHTQ